MTDDERACLRAYLANYALPPPNVDAAVEAAAAPIDVFRAIGLGPVALDDCKRFYPTFRRGWQAAREARKAEHKQWRITVPGYEYNPNGPDYHPDAYDDFGGTEEELRAFVLERETSYQAARMLRLRSPSWAGNPRRKTASSLLSGPVWNALNIGGEEGVCDEWCRGVVQAIEQPELFVHDTVAAAKEAAKARAEEWLHAAEAKVEEKNRKDAEAAVAAEKAELARLQAKYGG